jgi:DNA mismatch repair protein MutS2
MDERTFETLELRALIELAAKHVQTELGKRRMLQLRPSTSRSEILRALEFTAECVNYLNEGKRFGLSGIEDPEAVIARLEVEGISLDPHQILALEHLILVSKDLRERFKGPESKRCYPILSQITGGLPDLRSLLSAIHGKILPNGEIDDNASPELRVLRRGLTERRSRLHHVLESILRGQARAVQDDIVTFRNGRFVIPVRTDSRNQVPGVVHGISSSGQTTFIEPLTVIDQNNELVRLREQEEIEVSRILLSITEALRENREALKTIMLIVAELDFAQAKASFAVEFRCVRPQLSENNSLSLLDARHVLLEHSLRRSGGKTVPISLDLDETHQVLVISGPNAGGKTIVVKTVGLICLMAQMGFHVPAREALLPVYDRVFADIGDQQSIAANLSTFTAHMRNITEMVQNVRPPALVLLDEVGTGTDPDEGAALAIAIVDFFHQSGATIIASTHYPRLKIWAAQTPGVRNASVEFDEHTLQPTYRLILGVAGASSGLEIASRMSLAESILSAARRLIDPEHAQAREYLRQLKATLDAQENLRAALELERAATADKRTKLDQEYAKREETRKEEFEAALARVIHSFTAESDRAIRSLKDRIETARIKKAAQISTGQLKQTARKLSQEIQSVRPIQNASADLKSENATAEVQEIHEGDKVKVASFNQEGVVESIREGVYTTIVGSLRYKANREELIRISPGTGAKPFQSQSPSGTFEAVEKEISLELNVIGLTADEAIDRVDKFLDESFLAGIDNVRIIHGHGKGILRKAIAKFLKEHPQVEGFNLAPPEQGGGGATLVSLKNSD